MALLAQHFVELGASVTGDQLDARAWVAKGDLAQELEEFRIEHGFRTGGTVGKGIAEAIEGGFRAGERHRLARVHVEKRRPSFDLGPLRVSLVRFAAISGRRPLLACREAPRSLG